LKNQKFLTALLIVFCAAAGCGREKEESAKPQEIETAKVMRGIIEQRVLFTGNIVAKDAVNVFARQNGRVVKKLLKEGDPVKKGQGILMIDRDEIGYTFKPLIVDSPIDGYVGSILVDVGSYVYDRTVFQQNPAAVVVRPEIMRVKLDIPERYLGVILPGTKIKLSVDSLNGGVYDGTIITSSPVISEKTRTANVEVEVPNTDGRLRHGMFGRMNLVVDRRTDVLTAPVTAISWEGEKQFVYKVVDGKIRRTEVKIGMRNDMHVELIEGAAENDLLAVGDLIDLKDGEHVTVTKTMSETETSQENKAGKM
jgi:multidrug efflux pump subunit AcrA (membrane-fusion protein)